jgi:hypothetical protein
MAGMKTEEEMIVILVSILMTKLQALSCNLLRTLANAPWYIPNKILHTYLKIPTIREEITKFSVKYRVKITTHPNELAPTLLEEEGSRRLKRFKPTDLTTRFS